MSVTHSKTQSKFGNTSINLTAGSSYLKINSPSLPSPCSDWSIEGWFYFTAINGNDVVFEWQTY